MELINFTAKFFESLGCKDSWDGKVLKIDNVPESFEKTYRKGPYIIVFDKKNLDDKKIFMGPGEEIFRLITDALKKTASTTLLKMKFEINPKKIIEKNLSFKNSCISEIKNVQEMNFFYRFIFQTNFTYLNKKEQIINEIYIHDGEAVKGDLEGYPIEEGKKEEVSTKEIEKNYEIAKSKLKEMITLKTEEISEKLDKKLSKEIERIDKYYETNAKETQDKIEIEKQRILQLKENLHKPDKREALEKIRRSEKSIEKLKSDSDAEKSIKEKITAINDEKQKHSLNVDNNLLNTTVIYYPVFTFCIIFDKDIRKKLAIDYNPLKNKLGAIKCDSCGKPIKNINFCTGGHVACDNCIGKCSNCQDFFCTKCLSEKCSYCNSRICSKCKTTCKKCHKSICKKHVKHDALTGEPGCVLCLKECPKCRRTADPKSFKKGSNGISVCRLCIAKDAGNKVMKDILR
jgi:hypothetical protein